MKSALEHSPLPWVANGHTIESEDEYLWTQNEKTGRGVVATFPSAPKWRFNKKEREEWDAKTEANIDFILKVANRPKRNVDMFDSLKDAQKYYIEHGCKRGLGTLVDAMIPDHPWRSNFEEWLFEAAKE